MLPRLSEMLADRTRRWSWRIGHRTRATATFAVAAALVSVVLGLLAHTVSSRYLTDQRERGARDRAYVNARLVRDHLRGREADPGAALADLATEEGASALLRVDGEWYTSSVAVQADALPPDLLDAAESGAVAWQRHDARGAPHLLVAIPIPSVDALYAEIVPLEQLDQTLETLGEALLVAASATTALGAVFGFLAAGRLVRPLRRLVERAEAIAAGEAATLDDLRGEPDLRPLVASLDSVFERTARRAARDSRFVSDVSHEIRAPLAALSAAVEVMQRRRAQLPARSAEALDLLGEQIGSFQNLVLDLLEISRIDAGHAELLLEASSCDTLVRAAAAGIGLGDVPVSVADDVPPRVLLDRRRMRQALGNLLENARRYAGGPERITVDRRGDVLLFAVHDRGPGVPAAERERIFERFERGEHGYDGPSGTGLGLALVAEHARLHGGRAYVESVEGCGATFIVEVRLCVPE